MAVHKTDPAPGYPPEEGCYLRGNDYSPVAVAVILNRRREDTPADYENLVRAAVESGAALAGTIQTENIGLEKMLCNLVSNPNIRYLVTFGPESAGHRVGDAIAALFRNGVDERKRIIGTDAPTPYLFNVPAEFIDRAREQVTLIDLVNEGSLELLREVVWRCFQEEPVSFRQYQLWDPGAFGKPPLSGTLTWRVTSPEREPKDDEERRQQQRGRQVLDWVKSRLDKRAREIKKVSDGPRD
jgi:tetrahydromethanopterin S-methyltransferase subunit A